MTTTTTGLATIIDEFTTKAGENFRLKRLPEGQIAVLVRFQSLVSVVAGGEKEPLWRIVMYVVGQAAEGLTLHIPFSTDCVLVGLPGGVFTPRSEIAEALKGKKAGGLPGSVTDGD